MTASSAPPRSLRNNFSWTLASNIVWSGCQWGSLILLARIANPEAVGIYALAMAIALPLSMLSNLNLRALIITDVAGAYSIRDILGVRYTAGGLSLLIAFAISMASRHDIATAGSILLMTLAQTLDSVSDTHYGLLQRQEQMDRVAKSLILKAAGSIIMLGVLVAWTRSLMFGVAGIVLVRALVVLCYDTRPKTLSVWRQDASSCTTFASWRTLLGARWNRRAQSAILWKIAPLGAVSVLGSLTGNIPRYFVESSCGHKALGVFAALSVLPSAGGMIVNALGQVAMPRLARAFAFGRLSEYKSLLGKFVLIAFALGGAGIAASALFGASLLKLLYGAEYAAHSSLFVWLMASGACVYAASMLGCGLTAASEFRAQLPVLCAVTAISLATSAALIPTYAVTGGAIAMIVSSAAQFVMLAALTFRSAARRSQAACRQEVLAYE